MSRSLRILSWNILHGGGSRLDAQLAAIREIAPDIIILLEYRNNPQSDEFRQSLASEPGLDQQFAPETVNARDNTLLIASRLPFTQRAFPDDRRQPVRALEVEFELPGHELPLSMIAGHFPQKKAQLPYLEAALDRSSALSQGLSLIMGDLNTGIPFEDSETRTFYATHLFQRLLHKGWIDLWRRRNPKAREFSWVSTRGGNGFRYDHALGSERLDQQLVEVCYLHALRTNGLSDHSALLLELSF